MRVLLTVLLLTLPATLSAVERSEIPDKYKWDRTHLFADDAAWEDARARVEARIPEIAVFEGRLGKSPSVLYEALTTLMSIRQDLDRVWVYASMASDEDSRVSKGTEMRQSARQLWVQLSTASSYMSPELIAMGQDKVAKFVKKDARLQEFAGYLDDIVRRAPHTLTPAEEKLAAQAGMMANAGSSFHSTFTDAELPYPEITLSNGETVRLDAAAYTRYRQSPNRDDRMLAFQAYWGAHQEFRRSLAASLHAQMQAHLFTKNIRNYDSCLQAALFNNNIPVDVYHRLIQDVHANLPTLHRYLKLKERMLGLEQIGYEDLYAPSVKDVDLTFTPEEAIELCVKSNELLGEEYVRVLSGAFEEGWMDLLPNTGKRSGAYSTMVYGVHPYQLMNFNGTYDAVSTLAHESGHSLHSYYSSKSQPYVTHSYAIFVAEVASTLNENLLFYSMLEDAEDRDTELFLLGSALENFRTTLFRQVLFAEFELAIHEMTEAGTPLTGDNLNELYLGLLRKYYGHDDGVCHVNELYSVEWSFISHFYYNFYVYQYATSLVAGTSLANGVREGMARGSTKERDAYLALLSAGSSKYPIDLLKDAGVDMTTSEPFAAAMQEMNSIMDRMEALLEEKGAAQGSGR